RQMGGANDDVSARATDRSTEDQVAPEPTDVSSYDIPLPGPLRESIAQDWDPAPLMPHPARPDGAPYAAHRRARVCAQFPGVLIVVPAGTPRVRANDTDYSFRAASAFSWLTGETVEGEVLVLTPTTSGGGHEATLYLREYAAAGEVGYFASRSHGALW